MVPTFRRGDVVERNEKPLYCAPNSMVRCQTLTVADNNGETLSFEGIEGRYFLGYFRHHGEPREGDKVLITTSHEITYHFGVKYGADAKIEVVSRAKPFKVGDLVRLAPTTAVYRILHIIEDRAWIESTAGNQQVPAALVKPLCALRHVAATTVVD